MYTKKQYNRPNLLVVPYNAECMLQTLSKTGTDSKGDSGLDGPEDGGNTDTVIPSKEHMPYNAWDAWDDEDDWK